MLNIYDFFFFKWQRVIFSPFKSLFLYPFPASMSSGSDKVDTVDDGFSGAHAKLFPGAKHNGSGNMARDQKNPIVLNKFSLSLGL